MNTYRVCALVLVGLALAGCRREDDQRTETIDVQTMRQAREALDPAALERIDAGNAAYREGRFEDALANYREATRIEPDAAAAWFGVYMAELSLGNTQGAATALRRARETAPRASLVEPGEGEGPVAGPEAPAPSAPQTDTLP